MGVTNYKLLRAKANKNNEFYTTDEHMNLLFENPSMKTVFIDKIVYLPCDTENSKIYLYLVKHLEELQIKEILRTSDDYYSHLDLYEKCDVVFTNPPFTGLRKYVKWIDNELNKQFILFSSWMSFWSWDYFWDKLLLKNEWKILTDKKFELTPYELNDGGILGVNTFVFTNLNSLLTIKLIKNSRQIKNQKSFEYYNTKNPEYCYIREDGVLFVKNAFYMPNDWYGEVSIWPIMILTYNNQFDFIRKDAGRYIVKRKQ